MNKIILVFLGVLFLLIIISLCGFFKSNLGATVTESTTPNKNSHKISPDTVMIFHAPWCKHCKDAALEFKKASDYSNGKVVLLSSEDEETKPLLKKYNVLGFPTIMKADGTVYNGPRKSEEILEFAKGKTI